MLIVIVQYHWLILLHKVEVIVFFEKFQTQSWPSISNLDHYVKFREYSHRQYEFLTRDNCIVLANLRTPIFFRDREIVCSSCEGLDVLKCVLKCVLNCVLKCGPKCPSYCYPVRDRKKRTKRLQILQNVKLNWQSSSRVMIEDRQGPN